MLKDFSEIAPKAAVLAAVVWAGANYLIIGPEVAARVARADHIPVCEAGFREATAKAAENRAASVPRPMTDPVKEMAAAKLRDLQNHPILREMQNTGLGDLFGVSASMDLATEQYEQQKRAAKEAYGRALERIKEETATTLGNAGGVCGCAADAAIAETRTEWAVFSGTLGLIRPAPIKTFDDRMMQMRGSGRCDGAKAGS